LFIWVAQNERKADFSIEKNDPQIEHFFAKCWIGFFRISRALNSICIKKTKFSSRRFSIFWWVDFELVRVKSFFSLWLESIKTTLIRQTANIYGSL
jgi:hypothetical protein